MYTEYFYNTHTFNRTIRMAISDINLKLNIGKKSSTKETINGGRYRRSVFYCDAYPVRRRVWRIFF